jgi:ribose/xylose/arabinose/galactoside ABC-type transport system permease subunit
MTVPRPATASRVALREPARRSPLSALHNIAWPTFGIAVLILVNVLGDLLRHASPGMFGPGAFLHIAWVDGAPVGACIDILNHASKIVILALGMAIVVATRGVDLSVGSIMAIAGATAATLTVGGTPALVAIAIGIAAAIICGLFNGLMVTTLRLQPFVATLVLMVAGRGIAQMITDGQVITFQDPLLTYIGNGRPSWLPLPMPVLIAATLLLATMLITRRTAIGMMIAVVGCNPQAARLSGLRSGMFIGGAYVFSGVCAGIAGLIAASNIKAADPHHAGLTLELSAIFAVVIGGGSLGGGRFSLAGATMGALLMQTLTATMYARNVTADVAPLPVAVVILLVCVLGSPMVREWWWNGRRKAVVG